MSQPCRVLFICTGNCCRSQMAEALLRRLGGDRFDAFSAGSDPAGYVHPVAVEAMRRMGVSMDGQYSKSWTEFADRPLDAIITVCDSAAGRVCPTWPGRPATAHWGLPDPSFAPGTDEDRVHAALAVATQVRNWIEKLVRLPLADLDPKQRQAAIQAIAAE